MPKNSSRFLFFSSFQKNQEFQWCTSLHVEFFGMSSYYQYFFRTWKYGLQAFQNRIGKYSTTSQSIFTTSNASAKNQVFSTFFWGVTKIAENEVFQWGTFDALKNEWDTAKQFPTRFWKAWVPYFQVLEQHWP